MPNKNLKPWIMMERLREEIRKLSNLRRKKIIELADYETQCMNIAGKNVALLASKREREVLQIWKTNPCYTNKEIARDLNITERTVKFHFTSLLKKYGAERRNELLNLPVQEN